MTKYKIAFFDIDGTLADNLLPHEMGIFDRIPDSAKQALVKLKENGIEPVIATGRNLMLVTALAQQLNVSSVISSNGNQVTYHGKTIYQHNIPTDLLARVIEKLDQQKLEFLMETPNEIYAFEDFSYRGDSNSECGVLTRDEPLPTNILQLICHIQVGQNLDLGIPEVVAEKVAPIVVNIHAAEISKASGIHELLKVLDLSIDEALAFGDEENDFKMFDAVGFPVAMGNANPLLKEKAKYVTDAVHEDGVWNACIELGLFEA